MNCTARQKSPAPDPPSPQATGCQLGRPGHCVPGCCSRCKIEISCWHDPPDLRVPAFGLGPHRVQHQDPSPPDRRGRAPGVPVWPDPSARSGGSRRHVRPIPPTDCGGSRRLTTPTSETRLVAVHLGWRAHLGPDPQSSARARVERGQADVATEILRRSQLCCGSLHHWGSPLTRIRATMGR